MAEHVTPKTKFMKHVQDYGIDYTLSNIQATAEQSGNCYTRSEEAMVSTNGQTKCA
jgi:hypothetical protein